MRDSVTVQLFTHLKGGAYFGVICEFLKWVHSRTNSNGNVAEHGCVRRNVE